MKVRSTDIAYLAGLLTRRARHGAKRRGVTREQRAWAAGVFDGEGWVGCLRRGNSWGIAASVSQKDRRLLDRFARVLRFGKVSGPWNVGRIHQWRVHGLCEVFDLFETLEPWIDDVKHEQFISAITNFLRRRRAQQRSARRWLR